MFQHPAFKGNQWYKGAVQWSYSCDDTAENVLRLTGIVEEIDHTIPDCRCSIVPFERDGKPTLSLLLMFDPKDQELNRLIIEFMIENDLFEKKGDRYKNALLLRTKTRTRAGGKTPFITRICGRLNQFIDLKTGKFL